MLEGHDAADDISPISPYISLYLHISPYISLSRRVLEGHDAADDAHHKRLRRGTRVTDGYGGLRRATRVTAKGGHEALEKGVMAPN